MEIWETWISEFPELYILSNTINAIPSSQAGAERYISALSFVFTDKRFKLGQQILEDILKIKLNKELFYEICEEEVKALKEQQNM